MRAGGCFFCALCLGASCAVAQVADEFPRIEPYNKHYDRHLGHDHVYPDRGSVFRDVPKGATVVNYAGLSYRFENGVWFEPRGPAFIVVMPPVGVLVPSLPSFATPFESGGRSYLYANDIYYAPRPDLGGYEVVNDPDDVAPAASRIATPAVPAAVVPAVAAIPPSAPVPASAAVQASATVPAAPTVPVPASRLPNDGPTPTSESPALHLAAASTPAPAPRVTAYPRNGQSPDQQARDQYECYSFAVAQSGFDPLRAANVPAATASAAQAEFARARAACYESRGYSVR